MATAGAREVGVRGIYLVSARILASSLLQLAFELQALLRKRRVRPNRWNMVQYGARIWSDVAFCHGAPDLILYKVCGGDYLIRMSVLPDTGVVPDTICNELRAEHSTDRCVSKPELGPPQK